MPFFERKNSVVSGIPAIALPHILVLLLIFFMLSTVFKKNPGLPVNLPTAQQSEKTARKRDIAYIWLDRHGRLVIDGKIATLAELTAILQAKRRDPVSPLRLTTLRLDENLPMAQVYQLQEALREAGALNINYSTKPGF